MLKKRINGLETEEDEVYFNVKQNATIVLHAEDYYRTMIMGNEDSWNVRDRHMVDALDTVLGAAHPQGKAIIWAHNTHIGDYKYTDMVDEGQVNIGGLVRDKYGKENVALVGFGTFKGTVIASNSWGGEVKKLPVPSARKGSYDELFHQYCQKLKSEGCWVIFDHLEEEKKKEFLKLKGQRAIGVVYHPENESSGNYVPTVLGKRYDAFVFVDRTNALEPIIVDMKDETEIPETYPFNV